MRCDRLTVGISSPPIRLDTIIIGIEQVETEPHLHVVPPAAVSSNPQRAQHRPRTVLLSSKRSNAAFNTAFASDSGASQKFRERAREPGSGQPPFAVRVRA